MQVQLLERRELPSLSAVRTSLPVIRVEETVQGHLRLKLRMRHQSKIYQLVCWVNELYVTQLHLIMMRKCWQIFAPLHHRVLAIELLLVQSDILLAFDSHFDSLAQRICVGMDPPLQSDECVQHLPALSRSLWRVIHWMQKLPKLEVERPSDEPLEVI
jgi:hypothetical protein